MHKIKSSPKGLVQGALVPQGHFRWAPRILRRND